MRYKNTIIREDFIQQIAEVFKKAYNTEDKRNRLLQFEVDISKYSKKGTESN